MTIDHAPLDLEDIQWATIWKAIHLAIHGTLPEEGWQEGPASDEKLEAIGEVQIVGLCPPENMKGALVAMQNIDRESVYQFESIASALGLDKQASTSSTTDYEKTEITLLANGEAMSIVLDGGTPDYCDDESDANIHMTIVFGDRAERAEFDARTIRHINASILSSIHVQLPGMTLGQKNDLLAQLGVLVSLLEKDACHNEKHSQGNPV